MSQRMVKTLSFGVSGVNGFPVQVEVFCTEGMPMMEITTNSSTRVKPVLNVFFMSRVPLRVERRDQRLHLRTTLA